MHLDHYCVYIMTNRGRTTVYIGMTNDLQRRVYEHRHGVNDGFSKRYRTTLLVFFECASDVKAVIAREKQLKGWARAKKDALVNESNPGWRDLALDF